MRKLAPIAGIVFALSVVSLFWWKACSDHAAQTKAAATEKANEPQRAKGPRAPAKPATISGKVTRKADGGGVAGAAVSLAWAELGEDFGSAKRPTIVVTTEPSGAWTAKDVPPGDYVIAAAAKGLLPAERKDKVTVASGEQRSGIDFTLDAGGTPLRGTVSDVGGGPIQGARITARKQAFSFTRDAELVAFSGTDGTYELTLADGEYRVGASHDDYTPDGESTEIAGKPVTIDFTLIPGAVVRGQVIARDTGKPVPGAIVKAEAERSTSGRESMRRAVSDDKGEFVLRGLTSGSLELEARGRGYASAQPTTVALGIGEEVDGVQVFVDGAFSISGRVVKKGTKTGIAGAQLGAFSLTKGSQGESLEPSDSDGAFEIPGVRPGSYMLYAAAEGSLIEIGKNVEVVDRDVTDVIVELAQGVTLSGRVEPAGVASLTLELEGEVGFGNIFDMVKAAMCRGDSDATGAFTLHNAPPGKFKLQARAKDGRTGILPVTIASADQGGLVVKLEPRASIAGRVVDTSGKPAAGVRVSAELDGENKVRISMNNMREDTKTAADGSFKIVGLDPGTYEVRARNTGDWTEYFERADKQRKKVLVELTAGAEKTGVTLTVEARDGVIRGVVLGTDGKPAADAWVVARRERKTVVIKGMTEDMPERFFAMQASDPVLTGADGSFTITKLRKDATYTVVADGARGGSHGEKAGVKAGDSATVQLASLGTINLVVTQKAGPVKEYDVSCDGRAGDVERRAVTTDGKYKLERLAPGEYKCHVRADGGTGDGKVTVPAGEVALAIELATWGSLTGVVVSVLTGKPVPDLGVVPNSMDNAGGVFDAITGKGIKTDANGRFVVEKVGAGKGTLMFVAPQQAMTNMESHPYEAKQGQRVDLGTIKIVPPRTGEAATFGLTTEAKGDVLEVTNVKEGGPAAQVGVQVGDKITALEGQPVKQLGAELAHKLLMSGSPSVGQTVKLTLERGATVVVTAIKW